MAFHRILCFQSRSTRGTGSFHIAAGQVCRASYYLYHCRIAGVVAGGACRQRGSAAGFSSWDTTRGLHHRLSIYERHLQRDAVVRQDVRLVLLQLFHVPASADTQVARHSLVRCRIWTVSATVSWFVSWYCISVFHLFAVSANFTMFAYVSMSWRRSVRTYGEQVL